MNQPFLAMIVPLAGTGGGGGNYPDNTLPGPQPGPGYPSHPIYHPPGIWGPTDPRPTHPIAPGGPPLGIWGPPGPWPTPPIAPGGPPPGIWGPGFPYPDNTLPVPPKPGDPPRPDNTLPGMANRPAGRWAYSPVYGWVWVPDLPNQGLPPDPSNRPDNTLPGAQPGPDNTLPGDLPPA